LFTILFLIGVTYLIRYRLNLKKAAEMADDAIYPKKESEFASILIPVEYKEMAPLTKNTRSYQFVKWGTVVALVLLSGILAVIFTTDWLGSSFINLVYLFFVIISTVKHKGNLYIISSGIILHGKYYPSNQIKHYEIEQIVRWHELYGYDSRVNNAYKLTFKVKRRAFQPNYIVVEDTAHLEKISTLLGQQGIIGIKNINQPSAASEVSK